MNAVQDATKRFNIKLQNSKENSARDVTKLQASSSIDQPFALNLGADLESPEHQDGIISCF